MKSMLRKHAALLSVLVLAASAAHAQYVWLDEKGTKQYSDMPPPSSVPANRIIKGAAGAQRTAAPESPDRSARSDAGTPAPEKKGPLTAAERNAEFQKRRMEQAEKEKKAAEEERVALAKARNCDQARSYSQALQAGDRIARRDSNGERTYITDEQRSQELREAQKILADCK